MREFTGVATRLPWGFANRLVFDPGSGVRQNRTAELRRRPSMKQMSQTERTRGSSGPAMRSFRSPPKPPARTDCCVPNPSLSFGDILARNAAGLILKKKFLLGLSRSEWHQRHHNTLHTTLIGCLFIRHDATGLAIGRAATMMGCPAGIFHDVKFGLVATMEARAS